MGLRDSWKEVGKDFGKLGTDIGKTVVKTVKKGANAVSNWSDDENEPEENGVNTQEESKPYDVTVVDNSNK
ncbi:MAG: hypothetical protein ACI4GZ_03090 [Ruminococcus sp.]